jgi:hypothetical protein
MGKMKNHVYGWLEDYGFELGYDMTNTPYLEDFEWVANDSVDAQTYWKTKTIGEE